MDPKPCTYSPEVDCRQCNQLHFASRSRDLVGYYLAASQSQATRRAYAFDFSEFLAAGGVFPATPADIARYLASSGHLAASTLKRRLASLADAHISGGHPDPTKDPLIRKLLKGIARVHGAASSSATPLRSDALHRIVAAIPSDLPGLRDKALLLVAFACALRRSELVALTLADISLQEGGSELIIRRSKTDPFGQGRRLALPELRSSLCPVAALRSWLAASGIEAGPLFRAIDRWRHVGVTALSSSAVGAVVRSRARNAGLAIDGVSAHSLRSGFAVCALDAGMSLPAVQLVTRHKTLQGVAAYVRAVTPASMAGLPLHQ